MPSSSLALAFALMAPGSPGLAPAPAPAPAPATAAELAPKPAPAPAPAPGTVVVTTTTVTTTPTTSTPIVVQPTPAPVVVSRPPPPPAPVLSPPAPTWGPVQQASPARPSPERTERSIRTFRRNAVGVFTVGSLGMAGALGLQYMRAQSLQRCIDTNNPDGRSCRESQQFEPIGARYSALGMAMFVAGTAGAGTLLGNAAATRDVQLRGGNARRRSGLKLLGGLAVTAASVWMIGANYQLGNLESQCDGDPRCVARYRPLRWAANDGAALGIAAGAGMLGYAIAYEKQGKALMKVRARLEAVTN